MEEKSDIKPENLPVDGVEQIIAEIRRDKHPPDVGNLLFGRTAMREFLNIIHDPQLLDLDEMYLRGELCKDDFFDILAIMPEFQAARAKLYTLARTMMDGRRPKLTQTISDSSVVTYIDPMSVSGLALPLDCLRKEKIARLTTNPSDRRGIRALVISIAEMINFGFPNTNVVTCRSALLDYFRIAILGNMSSDVFEEFRIHPEKYNPRLKELIINLIFPVFDEIARNGGFFLPMASFNQYNQAIDSIVARHQAVFDDMCHKLNNFALPDDSDRHIDAMFREITDLACFRKIDNLKIPLGQGCIEVYQTNLSETDVARVGNLAFVRLIFGQEAENSRLELVTNLETRQEEVRIDSDGPMNAIDMHLNLSNGQLNHLSANGVEFRYVAKNGLRLNCSALRHIIFQELLDYLRAQKDDPNLVRKPEDMLISEVQVTINRDFWKQFVSARNNDGEIDSSDPEDEGFSVSYASYIRHLKGIQSSRLIRAITAILGEPRQGKGSHRVFTGKNGRTCPIPFHGSDPVAIGTLKSFLEILDLSPKDVFEQL